MKTALKTVNVVFFLLIVLLLFTLASLILTDTPGGVKNPDEIPLFGMEGLSSEDLPQEGPALVNLFASWCVPCRAEHPALERVKTEAGIPLFGIAVKDQKEDTDAFLEELGNPFVKVGRDYSGIFKDSTGAQGLPETLLIRDRRYILWRHRGPLTDDVLNDSLWPAIRAIKSGN